MRCFGKLNFTYNSKLQRPGRQGVGVDEDDLVYPGLCTPAAEVHEPGYTRYEVAGVGDHFYTGSSTPAAG